MIKGVFGNQNIERILLFLLVNEKCYGTQLQTLLKAPLTPIQNALMRLEKEGVLKSHYEGKIRFFCFNDLHPLKKELEQLLKKAYALLPSDEKRKYTFVRKEGQALTEREHRQELQAFWGRLAQVKKLSVSAKVKQEEESSIQMGKAEVQVIASSPSVFLFKERGYWLADHFPGTEFSNAFRWTLDVSKILISVEHLRYGSERPVHLLQLTPSFQGCLESIDPHLCIEDHYMGNIAWSAKEICFHWRVIGPKKNDELIYRYSS